MTTPFTRRSFLSQLPPAATGAGLTLAVLAASPAFAQAVARGGVPGFFDVRDHGARGDGTTRDTAAIQAAVDACHAAGGGIVFFPAGKFLSGTVTLKDKVTLHLSAAATLVGSPDVADYPAKPFGSRDLDVGGFEIWTLIYAQGAQNIAIEGRGTIDGNGKGFPPKPKIQPLDVASGPRPRGLFLKDCRRVTVRDVRISNSAMWSVHIVRCDDVVLDHLTVFSEFFVQQDGIVLDSAQNVRVTGCTVNTVDDALIFKSSFPQPCRNVTVANCVLTCNSSAIKFGTQSLGGFRNIAISNCACHDCRLGGLKFEIVDGGTMEDIAVSNLTMTGVTAPLFFRLGNRARNFGFPEVKQPQPIGIMRNIVVAGVRATLSTSPVLVQASATRTSRVANTNIIAGLPGHPIENITLSDLHFLHPGTGTAEEADRPDVPELPERYPENDMFGVLPAWGFWVRHARGIVLDNVRLDLVEPDLRSAFLADDVADLELSGFRADSTRAAHFIRLRRTRRAFIRGSRALGPVGSFLDLADTASTDIALVGNDTRHASSPVTVVAGVVAGTVKQSGNV